MNVPRNLRSCALAALLALPAAAAFADGEPPDVVPDQDMSRVMSEDRLQSGRLSHELQSLDWQQFRSVIEAIPKLRADVDAYGPAGWAFVQGQYKTHDWSRNIDRMDDAEREKLAALIDNARQPR